MLKGLVMVKTKVMIVGVLTAGAVLAGVFAHQWMPQTVEAYNQENLIRLHIVPHSDEPVDQELKYRVRNAIVQTVRPLVVPVDDAREAAQVIQQNLELIRQVAESQVAAAGMDYPVEVSFGRWWFPVRSYDGVTLAAGEYQAVRVTLGSGAGANWWCVLFPPLCFVHADEGAGGGEVVLAARVREGQRLEVKLRLAEMWARSSAYAAQIAEDWRK
jgi:stage II sporulation protein R